MYKLFLLFFLISPIITCPYGSYQHSTSNCVQCITGCPSCQGVLYRGDTCNNCSSFGMIRQDNQCKACEIGEISCGDTKRCHEHYELSSDNTSEKEQKCVPLCIEPNCVRCQKSFDRCLKCEDGFILDNGKCFTEKPLLTNSKSQNSKIQNPDNPQNQSQTFTSVAVSINSNHSNTSITPKQSMALPLHDDQQPSQGSLTQSSKLVENSQNSTASKNSSRFLQEQSIQCSKRRGYVPSNQTQDCMLCSERCTSCIQEPGHCIQCSEGFERIGWKCVNINNFRVQIEFFVENKDTYRNADYNIRKQLVTIFQKAQKLNQTQVELEKVTIKSLNFEDKLILDGLVEIQKLEDDEEILKQLKNIFEGQSAHTLTASAPNLLRQNGQKFTIGGLVVRSYSISKGDNAIGRQITYDPPVDDDNQNGKNLLSKLQIGLIIGFCILGILLLVILCCYCYNKHQDKPMAPPRRLSKNRSSKTSENNPYQVDRPPSDRNLY